MDDLHKPWWARSSFTAAMLGTLGIAIAGARRGWDTIPDDQIMVAASLWLAFVGFLRWAPSDRPPPAS